MELKVHDILTNAGFELQRSLTELEISKSLLVQYPKLPDEYLEFLKSFETITNVSDTTWFISNKDFDEKTDNEFKWNEFELMSLEWSEDDNEELKNIKEFWTNHIPIIMSVKDEYQFWAICLTNEKFGEIVHGQEPVFEETTKVCNNFNELIDLIKNKKIRTLSE